MEPVTAVLLDREQDPHGMKPMLIWSLALHALLIVLIVAGPRWLGGRTAGARTVVMSISLGGGAPGPANGGAQPLGGRPVQRAMTQPPERPEALRPPAEKTPEMALPSPKSKVKPRREPTPAPEVKTAPEGARGRTPSTGPQERFGSSMAETGAAGLGLGLSSGGAGTGGALDVGNFCCPDYLQVMLRRITENWNSRQGVAGVTVMKFTIQRDGRITNIEAERSSGYVALDLTAQRALQLLRQLPPLPAAYPEPALTVHLSFQYQR